MNPELIYDVGMNNGDDAAYYLRRGYRVVAVEAHPVLAREGERRFASEIKAGRLIIENVAIAEGDAGEIEFWLNEEHAEWSSFHRDVAARAGHRVSAIKVPSTSIVKLFEKHGVPHYLKIDIEGNDELCLIGLTEQRRPEYLSLESFTRSTFDRLRELGYSRFKFIDQASFCPIVSPALPEDPQFAAYWRTEKRLAGPSLVKKLIRRTIGVPMRRAASPQRCLDSWTFPAGSSGPFGEDTAGPWLNYDDAIRVFVHHEAQPLTDAWAWRDLHARAD